MQRLFQVVTLCTLLAEAVLAQSQTYIVPTYGSHLEGSAIWDSLILISNPQAFAVTVRVAQILPASTEQCVCPGNASVVVAARESETLDAVYVSGQHMKLGALVLRADAPVDIESWITRIPYDDACATTQVVKPIAEWLPAGASVWIPKAFSGFGPETTNLFVINPNSYDIRVHKAFPGPAEDFVVPAGSTAVHAVTYVPVATGATAVGVRMVLSSSDSFFALTSNGGLIRNAVAAR